MSTKDMRVAGRFKNSIIENDRRKLVGDQATFGSPFLLSGIGSGSGSGQVGSGRAGPAAGRRGGRGGGGVVGDQARARPPA